MQAKRIIAKVSKSKYFDLFKTQPSIGALNKRFQWNCECAKNCLFNVNCIFCIQVNKNSFCFVCLGEPEIESSNKVRSSFKDASLSSFHFEEAKRCESCNRQQSSQKTRFAFIFYHRHQHLHFLLEKITLNCNKKICVFYSANQCFFMIYLVSNFRTCSIHYKLEVVTHKNELLWLLLSPLSQLTLLPFYGAFHLPRQSVGSWTCHHPFPDWEFQSYFPKSKARLNSSFWF